MSDAIPTTLALAPGGLARAGWSLCLRPGDVLLAVDGRAFTGTAEDLALRFPMTLAEPPVVLTFLRGDVVFSVFAATPALGQWDPVALPVGQTLPEPPAGPAQNWVVMRDGAGLFEVLDQTPPLLALIAAPLWLLQMRLWLTLATHAATLAVAGVVSPWLALPLYAALSLHLWRRGPRILLSERRIAGAIPVAFLAAATEAEAVATFLRLDPAAQYRWGSKAADPAAQDPDTALA